MRANCSPAIRESVRASSVLAVPGGPSSSTCPSNTSAASSPSIASSLPTTTRPSASRPRSKNSAIATPSPLHHVFDLDACFHSRALGLCALQRGKWLGRLVGRTAQRVAEGVGQRLGGRLDPARAAVHL